VSDIVCISPVDGAEVARRRSMSGAEVAAALALAHEAQTQWSQATLAERKTKMLKFLDAMKAQNDAIVPELAMQMGRPVRYGGTLFMNRCDYIDPELAWTGVKDTGRGAGMGPFGFEAMTRLKSFHLRLEH
jgi:acyl-CoA reductase-like NAD-dependent aldehyde dehydrogenase